MINTYQLLTGEDLEIAPNITFKHPTVRNIFQVGEHDYFLHMADIVATPTDFKLELYDKGIDFEEISDYELFYCRVDNFKNSVVNNFIQGFSFKEAMSIVDKNGTVLVYDPVNKTYIDEIHYMILCDVIRSIHGFEKHHEEYGNEFTKRMLLEIEREERVHKAFQSFKPFLLNQVSGLINCGESKFDYKSVWDVPYYVFNDSVRRVQKVMEFKSMMTGIYGGHVDTSKISFEKMSWIGEL